LQIRGKIKTYDISLTHPLSKTRSQTLLADAGFASKDNQPPVWRGPSSR